MQLRLELFVRDPTVSAAFYTGALGFEKVVDRSLGRRSRYIMVRNGQVLISLVSLSYFAPGLRFGPLAWLFRQPPVGTEIILEVDDLARAFERVSVRGERLASPLQKRPWGLYDFRVRDPDGYYLRVTTPHDEPAKLPISPEVSGEHHS
jgi:catechol 2,3-dioxygenase-like lactoylglutathione lyase family enzyme